MGSTVASDFQSSALSARVGPDPLAPLALLDPLKLWRQRRRRGHRIAPLAPGRLSPGANGAFACPGTSGAFACPGTRGAFACPGTRGSLAWRAGSGETEGPGVASAGSLPPGRRRGTGPGVPPDRTDRRPDAPARDTQNGRSLPAYPGQSWEHGSRLPGWIRMNASRPGNVLLCEAHTRIKRDRGHAATMRIRQGRARPIPPPVL